MEIWETDEVGFIVSRYGKNSMSNLLHIDCSGKGGLLGIIALQIDAMFLIRDIVGCSWRVVTSKFVSNHVLLLIGYTT